MALHVEHITKAFGEKTAVDDLSFSMEHSGVFGLIGTNGAGKTTTIRIILGIMKSDAGRAEWDGRRSCGRTCGSAICPRNAAFI